MQGLQQGIQLAVLQQHVRMKPDNNGQRTPTKEGSFFSCSRVLHIQEQMQPAGQLMLRPPSVGGGVHCNRSMP
jgi:hypothetical protein